MTIETRFNKGEYAFIIENNKIIFLPVEEIEYSNKTIIYSFITSRAITSLDKDKIVHRDEADCYKSIDELANQYKNGK